MTDNNQTDKLDTQVVRTVIEKQNVDEFVFSPGSSALITTDKLFAAGLIPSRFKSEEESVEFLKSRIRYVTISYEYHF